MEGSIISPSLSRFLPPASYLPEGFEWEYPPSSPFPLCGLRRFVEISKRIKKKEKTKKSKRQTKTTTTVMHVYFFSPVYQRLHFLLAMLSFASYPPYSPPPPLIRQSPIPTPLPRSFPYPHPYPHPYLHPVTHSHTHPLNQTHSSPPLPSTPSPSHNPPHPPIFYRPFPSPSPSPIKYAYSTQKKLKREKKKIPFQGSKEGKFVISSAQLSSAQLASLTYSIPTLGFNSCK